MYKECTPCSCPVETAMKINRVVYPVVPPKTEYSLTELGKSIVPILNALCDWGRTFMNTDIGTNLCTK